MTAFGARSTNEAFESLDLAFATSFSSCAISFFSLSRCTPTSTIGKAMDMGPLLVTAVATAALAGASPALSSERRAIDFHASICHAGSTCLDVVYAMILSFGEMLLLD